MAQGAPILPSLPAPPRQGLRGRGPGCSLQAPEVCGSSAAKHGPGGQGGRLPPLRSRPVPLLPPLSLSTPCPCESKRSLCPGLGPPSARCVPASVPALGSLRGPSCPGWGAYPLPGPSTHQGPHHLPGTVHCPPGSPGEGPGLHSRGGLSGALMQAEVWEGGGDQQRRRGWGGVQEPRWGAVGDGQGPVCRSRARGRRSGQGSAGQGLRWARGGGRGSRERGGAEKMTPETTCGGGLCLPGGQVLGLGAGARDPWGGPGSGLRWTGWGGVGTRGGEARPRTNWAEAG